MLLDAMICACAGWMIVCFPDPGLPRAVARNTTTCKCGELFNARFQESMPISEGAASARDRELTLSADAILLAQQPVDVQFVVRPHEHFAPGHRWHRERKGMPAVSLEPACVLL